VSLEENLLSYRGESIHLPNRLAELAFVLARRMPETVAHGGIIQRLWGVAELDYADDSVKVAVSQLNAKIRPLGLRILNTWGVGYRMTVDVSKTESIDAAASVREEHVFA
jgi:DNA-binding response OmpR family regulator